MVSITRTSIPSTKVEGATASSNERCTHSTTFEDLYLTYKNAVYQRIRARVRRPEIAEDLTQETFLKAWKHWPPARSENLLHWLYVIANRTAIDYLRAERTVLFPLDPAMDIVQEERVVASPSTRDQRVERVLGKLSARAYSALFEWMAGPMGTHAGMPENVASRVKNSYDARKRFAALYERYSREEEEQAS